MRPSKRRFDELRPIVIETNVNAYAEGSVMYQCGNTKVLCTVSVNEGVPRFLRDKKQGWLTAEYGMLPRATHTRNDREAARGKQSGRTMEIQRLIGRSLLGRSLRTELRIHCPGPRTHCPGPRPPGLGRGQ